MILIKTNNGYLTKRSMTAEFSETKNINFAYVFNSIEQAEQVIKYYSDKFQNMKIEEE